MDELRSKLTALIDDPLGFVADPRPELRRMAAAVLAPRSADPAIAAALADLLASDEVDGVRSAAAQALASSGDASVLLRSSADPAAEVREAVAFAIGEVGDPVAIEWLTQAAQHDPDDGTREAAVAALGSLGDDRALPLLIELASSASPKVRRRAVVALSVFESEEAAAAIRSAAADRNPMVKEAAEMIVGGQPVDLPWPSREP